MARKKAVKPDESIEFEYASSEPDDDRLRCPVCRQITPVHGQESHYRQDTEQKIQCCTNCREDFERDTDIRVEADVMDVPGFESFHSWARMAIQDRPDELSGINDIRFHTE